MKTIKLESRYKDINTVLEFIEDNKGLINTNSSYIRCGTNPEGDSVTFIDFEGGPCLSVGNSIEDKKIKTIKSAWLIEFE